MLNLSSRQQKNYLNYVPLIDSQCDIQRSQYQNNHNKPSKINNNLNDNLYRSPFRDRQNKMNISNVTTNITGNYQNNISNNFNNSNYCNNTSTMSNTPLRNTKPSLSPLRMRKTNQQNNQYNNSHNQSQQYDNQFIHNNNNLNMSPNLNTSNNNFSSKSISTPNENINLSRVKFNPYQPQSQTKLIIEQNCFNHPQKVAKFYVQAPQENMYCCQKCAILLASQGFNIRKLTDNVQKQLQSNRKLQDSSILSFNNNNKVQNNIKRESSRKIQIQQFMSKLQSMRQKLHSSQMFFLEESQSSQQQLQEQVHKIQSYYQQFYEILNQHKKRVIEQVREQYQKNNSQNYSLITNLKQAIEQSQSMKKDILQSWDDIIFIADQSQYRPVINSYNDKLEGFKDLMKKNNLENEENEALKSRFVLRKLYFKNMQGACQALERGLEVQWLDEGQQNKSQNENQPQTSKITKKQSNNQNKINNENKNISTNNHAKNPIQESKNSDIHENPVQYLQKDQKFIKSSLKNLVGLFSSFDD